MLALSVLCRVVVAGADVDVRVTVVVDGSFAGLLYRG
jgi:hypothetical protein